MNSGSKKKFAIIVPAFNREISLQRLLASIGRLIPISDQVDLIISLEGNRTDAVAELSRSFNWDLGEKRIIQQPHQLGLRAHILYCGDFTEEYENLIVVEDDLYLSPYALKFAQDAAEFYRSDDRVAGISLYAPSVSETTFRPFIPQHDSYDAYFMQQASSWGQIWNLQQWTLFKNWYTENCEYDFKNNLLPWNIKQWPDSSWKRYFMVFLQETDRYFVYPKVSLSTNFSETGTHQRASTRHQVPLQSAPLDYRFPILDATSLRYDMYYERSHDALKVALKMSPKDRLIVDLYGTKPITTNDLGAFLLTSRKLELAPLKAFGLQLKPHEENVNLDLPGDELFLYKVTADFPQLESELRPLSESKLIYWSGLEPNLLGDHSDLHLRRQSLKHLDDLMLFKHLRIKMWKRSFIRLLRRSGLIKT